jgi:molecular chaperone DnaJ
MAIDPFKILGVKRDADPEEIKRAFRRLAKKYHPDITGGAEEKFRRILLAYQQLSGYGPVQGEGEERFDYYMKIDIDRKRGRVQDLYDDVRDGILTFFDIDAPEYLDLFLELTPAEARRGGRLKLELPLVRKCRSCYGFGKPFFVICSNCGGTGEEQYSRTTLVDIPEGTRDGWRTRLILDNLHLSVIFRVGKQGSDK